MPEPITLALVGGAILTEGIKFLYGQAAEAIKEWRERKKTGQPVEAAVPAKQAPPPIFQGKLQPLQYHLENVEPLREQLSKLSALLSGYASGADDIEEAMEKGDQELLLAFDALRQAMEAIYQQRLTLEGEQRPPSGPVVEGKIDVQTVEGTAAGVVAKLIASGRISGEAKANTVKKGGELYGVKADTVGGRGS